MSLAENLRHLRKERGLSQEELGLELNVSRQAVGKWENGQMPEHEHIKQICAYFDVDMTLMEHGDVRNSPTTVTVSSDINISLDGSKPESKMPPQSAAVKGNPVNYRAIRTVAAVILILLFPFWPRSLSYDTRTFLGFLGVILGIGLLIYNHLTRTKKKQDQGGSDDNLGE